LAWRAAPISACTSGSLPLGDAMFHPPISSARTPSIAAIAFFSGMHRSSRCGSFISFTGRTPPSYGLEAATSSPGVQRMILQSTIILGRAFRRAPPLAPRGDDKVKSFFFIDRACRNSSSAPLGLVPPPEIPLPRSAIASCEHDDEIGAFGLLDLFGSPLLSLHPKTTCFGLLSSANVPSPLQGISPLTASRRPRSVDTPSDAVGRDPSRPLRRKRATSLPRVPPRPCLILTVAIRPATPVGRPAEVIGS